MEARCQNVTLMSYVLISRGWFHETQINVVIVERSKRSALNEVRWKLDVRT